MIIGVGTDLCDIRRIEQSLSRFGQRFKDRVFTPSEQAYADSKAAPANSYAKRFAAKEALAKALSSPSSGHLNWTDVEVENGASGKPNIILHNNAKQRASDMTPGGHSLVIHLSLSDEPPYAQAFVIIDSVLEAEQARG